MVIGRSKILEIVGLNHYTTKLSNIRINHMRQLIDTNIGLGILLFLRNKYPEFCFHQNPTDPSFNIKNQTSHYNPRNEYVGSPIVSINGNKQNTTINILVTNDELIFQRSIYNSRKHINPDDVYKTINICDPLCFEELCREINYPKE